MEAKLERNKRRREKKKGTSVPPSFSSLPDDIVLNCLARTSRSQNRSLSLVSKSIRSLLSSPELYRIRFLIGNTEPCLYVCQNLASWLVLYQTNDWTKNESSLSAIRMPYSALSNSTTVAVGFEIYQVGGTEDRPSSAVRVLDCRTHTWRDAPGMMVARKRAKSAAIDGKIYVLGGTEDTMNWAEVFDLKTQTWKPFHSPCDGAKVVLSGGKLYVTSELKNYAYDSKQERWKEILEEGLGPEPTRGPWCVIENIKFSVVGHNLRWYDSEAKHWFLVKGLEDLFIKVVICIPSAIRLTNCAGKLVILWDKPCPLDAGKGKSRKYCKKISCAVIRLEKRIGEILGNIERLNHVLTVPNSYKLLSCINL